MHARAFALAVCLLAAALPGAAGSLNLAFGERSVTVSGATPGGDVVLYAVVKEPAGSAPAVPRKTTHALVLHDDDKDGSVTLQRQQPVPVMGVWVAVDVATGQWTAGGSPGFEAVEIPKEDFAQRDAAGQLRKLSALVPEVDAMVVRPRVGAWRIYAAKTSSVDEAGRDERPLRIDVGVLQPLSPSLQKLDTMQAGDVVVLIEPQSLHYAVVEVGQ